MKKMLGALAIISMCSVLLSQLASHEYRRNAARDFFAVALHSYGIEIDGDPRLAYARALAERSPLLALAGTDPNRLRLSAEYLASSTELLVREQEKPSDASLARSLYPTAYLIALADLERSRQTFLTSASQSNLKQYESAMHAAIEAGTSDIADFTTAFDTATKKRSFRLATHGGTITGNSILRSLKDISDGLKKAAQIQQARERCLRGDVHACVPNDLRLPAASTTAIITNSVPPHVRSIRSVISDSGGQTGNPNVVRLDSSPCVDSHPGPYYFSIPSAERPARILFLNELYFGTTDKAGPVNEYMRKELDMRFLPKNPLSFYRCPDFGRDLSDVLTARDPRLQEESIETSLAVKNHSAGFEHAVERIAETQEADVHLSNTLASFDLTPATLFMTHSAFATLFQSYNPSFGSTNISFSIMDTSDFKKLLEQDMPYSIVRLSVPYESILHDMRGFRDFEEQGIEAD